MQLLLGIPLELVHKGFEVGMVYMAGVLAGECHLFGPVRLTLYRYTSRLGLCLHPYYLPREITIVLFVHIPPVAYPKNGLLF